MTGAYGKLGVSATKEEVHGAVSALGKGLFPGAFCKIVEDIAGDPERCTVMHTDDVGTKAVIAYLQYKEAGDPDAFRGIAADSAVMNLDDMLCVGADGGFFFSNTIGRNSQRIGGDALAALIGGYSDFCAKMAGYGISLTMCGGETSDTGDIVATIFVDSTFTARMRREGVIDCSNIKPGDAIVGLASFGKAPWEDEYNSGIGSNGLTAARHLLLSEKYRKYTETYSSLTDPAGVYRGKYELGGLLPGTALTVGQALLSPTRTYAPIIRDLLADCREGISGIIHCTGGGLTKCKNFGSGLLYFKDSLFPAPPIFEAIRAGGAMACREMYGVFNMGHRMEIYCAPELAGEIIKKASSYDVEAKVIGRVGANTGRSDNAVVIRDRGEEFIYN